MNKIALLLFLSLSISTFAQTNAKKELKAIETLEQAEDYIGETKSKNKNILVFNAEKHQSTLAKSLLEMPVGFTKTERTQFTKTHYKIVKKVKEPHYRISYIFFDGNKMPVGEIYELRKIIMAKYNKGVDFGDLAKKYSMATNARKGGDSGWVKDGQLPIEIEEEANDLKYQVGSIFDVGITDDNGFYIVKKTYRLKIIKEVYVLKVQETID